MTQQSATETALAARLLRKEWDQGTSAIDEFLADDVLAALAPVADSVVPNPCACELRILGGANSHDEKTRVKAVEDVAALFGMDVKHEPYGDEEMVSTTVRVGGRLVVLFTTLLPQPRGRRRALAEVAA